MLLQDLASDISYLMPDDLSAVILHSPDVRGRFGAIGRSLEVYKGFKEMPEYMSTLETSSYFIYILDKNSKSKRTVVHCTRFIKPAVQNSQVVTEEIANEVKGQASLEEIMRYHHVDTPMACLFVTTDLAAPGVLPTKSKPYGLLAYKVLINFGIEHACSHIFAYMNPHTLKNLGRMGIKPTPLCGKGGYVLPPVGAFTFEAYQPYVLTSTEHHVRVFNDPEYAEKFSRWGALVARTAVPTSFLLDAVC